MNRTIPCGGPMGYGYMTFRRALDMVIRIQNAQIGDTGYCDRFRIESRLDTCGMRWWWARRLEETAVATERIHAVNP